MAPNEGAQFGGLHLYGWHSYLRVCERVEGILPTLPGVVDGVVEAPLGALRILTDPADEFGLTQIHFTYALRTGLNDEEKREVFLVTWVVGPKTSKRFTTG